MRRRLLLVTAASAALAGCALGVTSTSTSFEWTLHDSNRWGSCVVDGLGGRARSESVVRTAAGDCVRFLRPDVAEEIEVFADCAAATNAADASATDLVFALELERCLGH